MARPVLTLVTESFPDEPGLDTAVSRALLLRVASGEVSETFRLHACGPVVAFGRRDTSSPDYPRAVAAARAAGFEAVERLAGGRAAVFHEGTLAFSHARPDPDPRAGICTRFERTAGVLCDALAALGVDARVGPVEGEYCPGEHSVNARGRVKIAGIGQRLVARAVHVGGVVVVAGAARVRDVLVPVYEALGLAWRPSSVGSVEDEVPGASLERVAEAILGRMAEDYEVVPARLDEETLARARDLVSDHLSPSSGGR